MAKHRIVIVGGGFGGLNVALGLRRAEAEVTLLDRRNFHLFQPLLYQVATGGLSPADIASPLRSVLRRNANTRVVQAEATAIDPAARVVRSSAGEFPYDTLVVATGCRTSYFGHDDWESRAPGLKTVEDATLIRSGVLRAFEHAENEDDESRRRSRLTFAIVGGGPTGVELAGAIGELARHTLRNEFRRIRTDEARVLLLEGGPRLLPAFPAALSRSARRSLERLGVEVRCDTMVQAIDEGGIELSGGERIAAATVLWAAGVRSTDFGRRLAASLGVETDRLGRIPVDACCAVPGYREVFVLGDLAAFRGGDGASLPGIAPVAMQQGRHVARSIVRRLAGERPRGFRYRDKGQLAVIGRAAAVADLGPRLRMSGYPAWLLWLFVHILYLVEFRNRVLVAVQWAFSYLSRNRGARLITGEPEG